MPLLNDDELRAIRERFERANALPKVWSKPTTGIGEVLNSWDDVPALLEHADALQEEVGRLREALAFYASVEPWKPYTRRYDDPYGGAEFVVRHRINEDGGKVAREALRQAEAADGA